MIIAHLSRVCYPFHPFGGLEQHVYRLTLELARQGLTVQLITQPPDSTPPDIWPAEVKHSFVTYHLVKFLRRNSIPDRLINYPLFSLRLANRMRKLSPIPQVVHAHGLTAFGYALRPRKGVPLVLNPHGMEEFKNMSRLKQLAYVPFRAMLRFAARRAAAVIATDESLIAEAIKYLKIPRQKIHLIPNAIDLVALDLKLATAVVPDSGFLILSVGRLEENKGFGVGLAAIKQLEAALPPGWKWVIVGEGSQRGRLEAEIARLGLGQQVQLPGSLPDEQLYGLYRAAKLFLHPTLYEGSSLVTLEAMACGLPVVASATGGLPDKVRESGAEENGRLALPGNSDSLAAKLVEVLKLSEAERGRLGQNGRKLVETRFSWRAAGQATLEMYRRLVSDNPAF